MPRTMNWPMLADDMNMTITVEVAEETCGMMPSSRKISYTNYGYAYFISRPAG